MNFVTVCISSPPTIHLQIEFMLIKHTETIRAPWLDPAAMSQQGTILTNNSYGQRLRDFHFGG